MRNNWPHGICAGLKFTTEGSIIWAWLKFHVTGSLTNVHVHSYNIKHDRSIVTNRRINYCSSTHLGASIEIETTCQSDYRLWETQARLSHVTRHCWNLTLKASSNALSSLSLRNRWQNENSFLDLKINSVRKTLLSHHRHRVLLLFFALTMKRVWYQYFWNHWFQADDHDVK